MKHPNELAKHLTELHEQSLKGLYDVINGHKESLRNLVQQAQDEVAAAVAASRQTQGSQAEDEDIQATGDPTPAPGGVKRKQPATAATSAQASQPVKRRGRPRKQVIEPVIEEEAEGEEQGAADGQQKSLSAAVPSCVLSDDHAATDVTVAPAAAAPTGRTTRGHSKRAEAAAAATRSRAKRGAATAATTGHSTRSRRGATAVAEAELDAITEETHTEKQQEDLPQYIATDMQQQQQQECMYDLKDAQMGDAAQQQQQQQEDAEQQHEHPQHEHQVQVDSSNQQQPNTGLQHLVDATDCPQQAPSLLGSADNSAATNMDKEQAFLVTAAEQPAAQDSTPARGGDDVELQLHVPDTAAAPANLPKTPGFSLKPSASKKPGSETPCLGRSTGNSTRCQQQEPSATRPAAASPAPAGPACGDSADRGAAAISIQRRVPGTANARRQGSSAVKGHSLSFGQALPGPLFCDAADLPTPAAEPTNATAAAAAVTEAADTVEGAAGPANWRAFLSSVHADDAPTPAHSHQRLRSHSGAASVQQQEQRQQSVRRSAAITPDAAAASSSRRSRQVSNVQQLFQSPTAAAQASSPVGGLALGCMATRSSMQAQQNPSLQAERLVEGLCTAAHADAGQQSGRSRKATTPRSAKKSIVAAAVAVFEAAAAGTAAGSPADTAAEVEEHEEQQVEVRDPEDVQLVTVTAGAEEDEEGVPAVGEDAMAERDGGMESYVPAAAEAGVADNATLAVEGADADMQGAEDEQQAEEEQPGLDKQQLQQENDLQVNEQDVQEPEEYEQQDTSATVAAATSVTPAVASQSAAAVKQAAVAPAAGKGADALSAWLAATAAAAAGVGDKARQQLEAAKEKAPVKSNLVSGIRSFVPAVSKKEAPPPAAGKVKVKVKAIEQAQAARHIQEVKAAERAARQQQQQQHSKPRPAGPAAAAAPKPQGTPSGAVAQSKVAAVERAATGLSGSGGAVRVLADQTQDEPAKPADRDAAQKRAEKEAENAKRAMDKADREERMKRAEQKRKEDDIRRRAELAEKQRLKEERVAAAAALKGTKPAGAAGGGKAGGVRIAGPVQAGEAKPKPHLAAAAAATATDPSSYKTPAAPKAAARMLGAAAVAADTTTDAASADSPSLEIKLLDPVSTGGKAAAHEHPDLKLKKQQHNHGVMGPPAPVEGKTPGAFKTPAPLVSEQEKRNVEALKSSPYVNPGSKRTPHSQQQQAASYIISPYRDDDVDTPDRSHKPVPDWARSSDVYEAVKAQQHVDPDTIFGARQTTCDLGDMFVDVPGAGPQPHHRHKVRKLGQRTSSADWSQDRLTWQEEINYKKQAGWL